MAAPLRWFPFYVDDWDTDEKVRRLTFEERGVFLSLLCWQWREGSLPADHRDVAVTLRAPPRVVTKLYRWFFVPDGGDDGRVTNSRMEQVREQQVHRLERDRVKAAAYRGRMRGRHSDVTEESPARSRNRIREEIKTSLSARAETANGNGSVPTESPQGVKPHAGRGVPPDTGTSP